MRIYVAWKWFENEEELLGATLNKLVIKGLTLRDMKWKKYNCSKPNKLEMMAYVCAKGNTERPAQYGK